MSIFFRQSATNILKTFLTTLNPQTNNKANKNKNLATFYPISNLTCSLSRDAPHAQLSCITIKTLPIACVVCRGMLRLPAVLICKVKLLNLHNGRKTAKLAKNLVMVSVSRNDHFTSCSFGS